MTFSERQKQFALASTSGVLLLGVILLLVNILASWVYLRWDMTQSHAYSLSHASKKLVRSLDEPIIIKAYFSLDLPAPYNTYSRYVKDLLTEYRAVSHGRVRFELVSPVPPKEFEDRAMQAGLAPLQFEEMGSDKLQIKRGFMGLILFYRDHSEALPVIKDLNNLEYDITSRLARMTRKNKKVIGLTEGHGELVWKGSQVKIAQDLPAFYDLSHAVSLPSPTTTQIQADALFVVGPQQKLDDKSLWEIDQAIMRGIPVAFLVDGRKFLMNQFMVMPHDTGLQPLLKTYGVQLTDQLVYDAQCESVGMTQNVGGFSFTTSVRYPYVPLMTRLEKKHPIMQGIDAVALPLVSRVEPGPPPGGVTYTPLLFTSDKSWLAPSNTYSVAPTSIPQPKPNDPHGPYAVGAVLEGTFPSYFADKLSPVKGAVAIPKSPKTAIFVLGTSQVLNTGLPEFRGSDALLTNALAYLAKDDILIGIQSKGNILRPLKPVSGAVRDLVRIGCIVVIPLLPALWGLVRWRRRESWRKTISLGFVPR